MILLVCLILAEELITQFGTNTMPEMSKAFTATVSTRRFHCRHRSDMLQIQFPSGKIGVKSPLEGVTHINHNILASICAAIDFPVGAIGGGHYKDSRR